MLISPYPYAKPDEIWAPQARATDGRGGHTYALDELPRLAALPAFADVMATSYESVLMTGEFAPESFGGVLMSGNAFNFLGVPPVTGRTIQPSDIRPDGQADPVVVLSHKLWLRLFEGSPSAVGRTLRLNGVPHTIVGVMPPRFGWYGNDGFWLPLSPIRKDLQFINPIARLVPGATKEVAEQQLAALHKQLAAERPGTFPAQGFTTLLNNYLDVTVASGEMRTSLRLLLGAVAFLLLIACANVANLQLARGTTRGREMAVRISIGADRRRLVRQLLTENVLLAVAGGMAGVLFAFAAIRSIVALMPEFYVPNESRVEINVPVLLFALGDLGPHRHHLRPGAGAADVQAGCDRRPEGRAQHGWRRRGPPRPQPARRDRGRPLGGAAGRRRLDGPHVSRAAEHGHGREPRARAGDGRAAPAGDVTTRSRSATASSWSSSSASGLCRASRPSPSDCRSAGRSHPSPSPVIRQTTPSASSSISRPPTICARSAFRCAADGCSTPPKCGAAIGSR